MYDVDYICYSLRGAESAIELLAESFESDEYQSKAAWFIADMLSYLLDQLDVCLSHEKSIDNVCQKEVL